MRSIAMKKKILVLVPVIVASLLHGARPQDDDAAQEAREEAFSKLLTGARLTGFFTLDGAPDAPPQKDSYTIKRAEHVDGDQWLIESLIEYGDHKLEVPLYLDVKWAGDTPVITLDQVAVPGMGTFDARVLFHGTSYAGLWSGKDHGGTMAGKVERAPAGAKPK
jgi:hypothetical protein